MERIRKTSIFCKRPLTPAALRRLPLCPRRSSVMTAVFGESSRMRGDSSFSADQVEAISLYGEYAIDFAAQAMRYAHLVVLSAIDAQISLEEQKQEDSI